MAKTKPDNDYECKYCGKIYTATSYGQKYCSKSCGNKDNAADDRRGTNAECIYCSNEFERSRDGQSYCSVSCANKHQYETGQRDAEKTTDAANDACKEQGMEKFKSNPTKRVSKRGYKLIYIPSAHPELEQGWLKYHHFVWWQNTGELPPEDKIVHHKNGDKLDNKFENLEVMTNSDHIRHHWQQGSYDNR